MVLVFEGLAYALAPSLVKRMLEALRAFPEEQMRWAGLCTCAAGIFMLYGVTLYFR